MAQHKNFHIIKRIPGVLNDKIWTSDDCWEADDEIMQALEKSEIFPPMNVDKSQTEMTGKHFIEKWRGVIKGVDIFNLRVSKLSEK